MSELDLSGVGMTSQRTRNRLVERLQEQGIRDPRILEVMKTVPRHVFLEEALAHLAYEDKSLPIGFNQTMSQPYIVARMTEVLLAEGLMDSVLEVGTGSGYQAAVLSQLVGRVYTVERVGALLERAVEKFRLLKLRNVSSRHADGTMGWPERGPYQGIIVTASPMHVPEELIDQLAPGGRLVVPVGGTDGQELTLITKTADGDSREVLEKVNFVPLVSGRN